MSYKAKTSYNGIYQTAIHPYHDPIKQIKLTFQNTGTEYWDTNTKLGIVNDEICKFAAKNWIGSTRIVGVNKTVAPGESYDFIFNIDASKFSDITETTTYTIHLDLVQEMKKWFRCGIDLHLTVWREGYEMVEPLHEKMPVVPSNNRIIIQMKVPRAHKKSELEEMRRQMEEIKKQMVGTEIAIIETPSSFQAFDCRVIYIEKMNDGGVYEAVDESEYDNR